MFILWVLVRSIYHTERVHINDYSGTSCKFCALLYRYNFYITVVYIGGSKPRQAWANAQACLGKILVNCADCFVRKLSCDITSLPHVLPAWLTWQLWNHRWEFILFCSSNEIYLESDVMWYKNHGGLRSHTTLSWWFTVWKVEQGWWRHPHLLEIDLHRCGTPSHL